MSEIKLLPCPFCGEKTIYKISREDYLGTVIPQLFCNSCKMIFEVENDSPYLNDEKTHAYLKEKLYRQFNTRKPMQEIVERLEDKATEHAINGQQFGADGWTNHEEKEILQQKTYEKAIEIVKEVGGMNET